MGTSSQRLVTGAFPQQRANSRRFDVFFDEQAIGQIAESSVIWDILTHMRRQRNGVIGKVSVTE